MPLDELADLVRRWQVAGGRLDRRRVVAEGVGLLRGLSPDERRTVGRALGDQGVSRVLDRLDPHLPGTATTEQLDRSVERLLDLDADHTEAVLAELDAATDPPPPPPPAPPAPAGDPERTPLPGPAPGPDPLPKPAPGPDPLPEPQPLPEPHPLPRTEVVPPPALVSRQTRAGAAHDARPAQPAHGDHALDRLRQVDDLATTADEPDDVLGLLRAFPDGWQRRRAADRLLAAGALVGIDVAALLSLFSRDGDRTRIAAGLAREGLLEVAQLHGLVPPAAARRLARRGVRR